MNKWKLKLSNLLPKIRITETQHKSLYFSKNGEPFAVDNHYELLKERNRIFFHITETCMQLSQDGLVLNSLEQAAFIQASDRFKDLFPLLQHSSSVGEDIHIITDLFKKRATELLEILQPFPEKN